jgi:hypothetical protein
MRAVLDYCTGRVEREVPAGTVLIHEGGKTGHLFVRGGLKSRATASLGAYP